MSKEQNVINYYVLCNKLKNVIRTGWKDWNVQRDRIESVAEAVHNILKDLINGKQIEELYIEFEAHETKESIFAYQCDKLECDLQCKLYDEENYVD